MEIFYSYDNRELINTIYRNYNFCLLLLMIVIDSNIVHSRSLVLITALGFYQEKPQLLYEQIF